MFALGMCQDCFRDYLDTSGGTHAQGADPPSFGPPKKRRLALKQVSLHATCQASLPDGC